MMCRKKIRYRDKISAMLALADARRRDSGEIRYYKCPKCKGWHLTSKPQRSEHGKTRSNTHR